jgi:hypothetical protein
MIDQALLQTGSSVVSWPVLDRACALPMSEVSRCSSAFATEYGTPEVMVSDSSQVGRSNMRALNRVREGGIPR